MRRILHACAGARYTLRGARMRVQLSNLLRRRERPRGGHPTPQEAFSALEQGLCMYAPVSKCSSAPKQVGLRGRDDVDVVLCCKAHVGKLWRMDARYADKLGRALSEAFRR